MANTCTKPNGFQRSKPIRTDSSFPFGFLYFSSVFFSVTFHYESFILRFQWLFFACFYVVFSYFLFFCSCYIVEISQIVWKKSYARTLSFCCQQQHLLTLIPKSYTTMCNTYYTHMCAAVCMISVLLYLFCSRMLDFGVSVIFFSASLQEEKSV